MFLTIQPPTPAAKVYDLKKHDQRADAAYILSEGGVKSLALTSETITVATEGQDSRQDLIYHLTDDQGRHWAQRTLSSPVQPEDTDFLLTGSQFANEFNAISAKLAEKAQELANKAAVKQAEKDKKAAEKQAEKERKKAEAEAEKARKKAEDEAAKAAGQAQQ